MEAFMDTLYIVIPAYNEEENINQVIEDWYPIVQAHDGGGASRLVIIDDGSRDRTFSILQGAAASKPLLCPITKPNGGHGATVLYGYRYALAHGADYVFQTDSDGQTLPEEFEPFWAERENYDMVIGWRKERQDGASRVFVTKTLKAVIKLCFGVSVKDANTPYRLMKAETMKRYIDLIPQDFNLSNVLLSVIYQKKGCSVLYIPITFRPRQGGVNSINMKKIFKIGEQALSDFRKLNEVISKEEEGKP
jgi:glycosyltransferase involved in cell wall biosynthesis